MARPVAATPPRQTGGTPIIAEALSLPGGARFMRCALQVNPFEYLVRHKKKTSFSDEASYNTAIVAGCKDAGIEVIAITDHYRTKTAAQLTTALIEAGLTVFPGCEVTTKDGVHVMCLFDPGTESDTIERFIGGCGVQHDKDPSPVGTRDFEAMLVHTREWGGICVAAHITTKNGVLMTLRGQAGAKAWKSDELLAGALSASLDQADQAVRTIIDNKDPQYQRSRPVAIIYAQDVNDPADLQSPFATSFIKMSRPTVEALRQAFLDPSSRIRLTQDAAPNGHSEFLAMAWEGGFLDGARLRFNANLNVLIGGRGAGKSTIVESLRYALELDPVGEDARRSHESIIRHVLKPGTKVSLYVRSHRPNSQCFLIERTVPNPAIVRDDQGKVIALRPAEVMPRTEVYGQHEISEISRSPERLTQLLQRFIGDFADLEAKKREIRHRLERSRSEIVATQRDLGEVTDRLASLTGLEETMRRFTEAGLETRLREQSLLVREERLLATAQQRLTTFDDIVATLRENLPVDRAFLADDAIAELPGRDFLRRADVALAAISVELIRLTDELASVVESGRNGIGGAVVGWEGRKASVQEEYERILRELQQSKVDGEEFIRLRRQIESLRPLKEKENALSHALTERLDRRRSLLAEWEDAKSAFFRQLERAATRVSRQLQGRVLVTVTFAGNRDPLAKLLREGVQGRLSDAIEVLRADDALSLRDLVDACRQGAGAVGKRYRLPTAQAERLARAGEETLMQIEELDLPPTTSIRLNVAAERKPPAWQPLEELSTGQKATAVLLLLLLESDAPLVVDQPEDDLDNRFITDSIVPKMREEKQRRQFVFATHNANIPVLGDAELIVGLTVVGEAASGHATIRAEDMGSIDSDSVRHLAGEILEGGREAFDTRRLKYGF